jgi:hypothetical protein
VVLDEASLPAVQAAVATAVRPLAKAALGAGTFASVRDGRIVFALPTDAVKKRADDQRAEIEKALADHFGRPVGLDIVVDGSSAPPDAAPGGHGAGRALSSAPPPQEDDDVDLSALVDMPKEASRTGLDRIKDAFPGAELIEEDT